MPILITIYLLYYVSCTRQFGFLTRIQKLAPYRLIGTTRRSRVPFQIRAEPSDSMQCCPPTWAQGRPRSNWKPTRHHSMYPLCRIHHYVGSFVRLLLLIRVGPSADFCTTWDRNVFLDHIGKPSIYLLVCMAFWGLISVLARVTHDFVGALSTRFLLGICECAFFLSELPLANVSRTFSRNCREPRPSFRNGTNVVDVVYELLSSCVVAC